MSRFPLTSWAARRPPGRWRSSPRCGPPARRQAACPVVGESAPTIRHLPTVPQRHGPIISTSGPGKEARWECTRSAGRRALARPLHLGAHRDALLRQGDELLLVARHLAEASGLPVGLGLLDPLARGGDEVPEQ